LTNDVAVIGAGFAGLCMAIQLEHAGVESYVVFEKADDIGGVWRDNAYPGAACDLPSYLYSYSFEQPGDWTHTYGRQPEILHYLQRAAQKHRVWPHLRLGTEITHARFDAGAGVWRLRAANGEEHSARVLVAATGQLNRPRLPRMEGLGDFAGTAFHSSRWGPDRSLDGKSVAVIGNGCSAVQIVPSIAAGARQVYVFQRSPKWIIPKMDRRYGAAVRWLYGRYAWPRRLARFVWFGMAETIAYSPLRRGIFGRVLTMVARYHLRRQVPDPELRAALTPDYPFGCNRMILSNDYYPALCRPNTELVTDGIARIVGAGVETVDGRVRSVDAIVYATGFDSTDFLAPIVVTGPAGRLSEIWRDGASAYLGTLVPGFPNLFVLYGPNTSSTNNSIIHMIESQVRYVLRCLRLIGTDQTMEVSQAAFAAYQKWLRARLRGTVWEAGCSSWYKTESGRITNTYPSRALRYRLATRRPKRAHFLMSRPAGAESERAVARARA
jgi:cation diffusion facilitator CzcD-associated flavoprotein CzcO